MIKKLSIIISSQPHTYTHTHIQDELIKTISICLEVTPSMKVDPRPTMLLPPLRTARSPGIDLQKPNFLLSSTGRQSRVVLSQG